MVDFFERTPGQESQRRVKRLLEWWTRYSILCPERPTTDRLAQAFRKVFGRNRREELSSAAKANLSVNMLARQRVQLDDAAFDSD